MRYVDVTGNDLQREFHLARSQPRHLAPQPKAPTVSPRPGLDGVADALLSAQHAIEMFRRPLPEGFPRRCLDRLANRLTKILSEVRKLDPRRITGRDWPDKPTIRQSESADAGAFIGNYLNGSTRARGGPDQSRLTMAPAASSASQSRSAWTSAGPRISGTKGSPRSSTTLGPSLLPCARICGKSRSFVRTTSPCSRA